MKKKKLWAAMAALLLLTLRLLTNTPESEDQDFQAAKVSHVIDGDTIWVEIEEEEFKVRMIGVDTPERGETFYQEATDYTRQHLEGKVIYLEKDRSDTDRYDRLLRYIWLEVPKDQSEEEKDQKLFNGFLVREGLAKIVTFEPDTKYHTYYEKLGAK